MSCNCDGYGLPTIEFVGGSSQKLVFNIYHTTTERPYELSAAEVNFSVVSHLGKLGNPIISKLMTISGSSGDINNVASVELTPDDTVNLNGKYIYQISIKDVQGTVEIPDQGILYITNNINKNFAIESNSEQEDSFDE